MSTVSRPPAQHRARCARVRCLGVCLAALWLACSPSVGSDAWCEKMRETPKADWSTRQAADFSKHCIFN
jgi:hypothetical protein